MTPRAAGPRVFNIPAGLPFLPTLVEAVRSGRFHEEANWRGDDPLALSATTIFVPTRRAARELRSLFVEMGEGRASILPTIRPLGEFEEDRVLFESADHSTVDLDPPVAALDRLLHLAPLVRRWIERLPGHLAALYGEDVVVPASSADALWLARDLTDLMDEIETEGADWSKLGDLVPEGLANWWQVTLAFLSIVSEQWPAMLAELGRSNPAAHRNALIRTEAARLQRNPPAGPVIVAGSTGSIPATAELLSVIARLPNGAIVLPGLDQSLDNAAWNAIGRSAEDPSVYGHPQYQLRKLIAHLRVLRGDVEAIADAPAHRTLRLAALSEALRPADTTDAWAEHRSAYSQSDLDAAFAGVTLLDAPTERDEALAIAIALRQAIEEPGQTAALVTGDRILARRVSAELRRFGITADDSGGTPLFKTPPATLLLQAVRAVFSPGDPVAILSLLKHPLLSLGLERTTVRRAAEMIELVALRGGTGRPDIATLATLFEDRFSDLGASERKPFWLPRIDGAKLEAARSVLVALEQALVPLVALREGGRFATETAARISVEVLEALGRSADGSLTELYAGDAGAGIADFLRALIGTQAGYEILAGEWPGVLDALIAPEAVKPSIAGDGRIAIWGALEARLQTVDLLVVGGLNEGTWPRRAEPDRFLSRGMKSGLSLEPPERRIGQAAHDFMMALGGERVILSRAARSGDAPAVPSRWLQRLTTFLGEEVAETARARGRILLGWAQKLDERQDVPFAPRPNPKPPLPARPKHFSVTEIETLRRDPYAIYAKRVLKLQPLDEVLRDPSVAERGNLFHDILHGFTAARIDPHAPDALDRLIGIGNAAFDEAALPDDLRVVWWPRFEAMAVNIIAWEQEQAEKHPTRHSELVAGGTTVGSTSVTLGGRADRIDLLPGGMADILDYKTGSSPSKRQAHMLVAPQLALEAALLRRGAFADLDKAEPAELAYIRLKPNGAVEPESILEIKGANASLRSAADLAEDAWARLETLIKHYADPHSGYLSRALPFRETETSGDYDHLARVLEWSAGAESGEGGEE
ncbi:double-strand break repair protein AddB [Tianweitania populi]|uniref:Double-strand break repair protein AddB n=1 Tax=Tianweitania populi TaxID=1607949 RepID=A0A8J3GMH0_9HYPH|nr:double-strand break repair protein AddB [Tianweitania populi]GHD17172.1 double-strand break repair protein AddB [Tianweitania populi]